MNILLSFFQMMQIFAPNANDRETPKNNSTERSESREHNGMNGECKGAIGIPSNQDTEANKHVPIVSKNSEPMVIEDEKRSTLSENDTQGQLSTEKISFRKIVYKTKSETYDILDNIRFQVIKKDIGIYKKNKNKKMQENNINIDDIKYSDEVEIPSSTLQDKQMTHSKSTEYILTIEFYTYSGLMKKYLRELKNLVCDLLISDSSHTPEDYVNDIDKIKYKFYYRCMHAILLEMESISTKHADTINLYEEAINIVRVFTIGFGILGKTLRKLECNFKISVFIYLVDNESIFHKKNVTCNEKSQQPSSLNKIDKQKAELLYKFYEKFCEEIIELDACIKVNCRTKEDVVKNLTKNRNVFADIDMILNEIAHHCVGVEFVEERYLLIRIFYEVRDCIFQNMVLKSFCGVYRFLELPLLNGFEHFKEDIYRRFSGPTYDGEKQKYNAVIDRIDKIKESVVQQSRDVKSKSQENVSAKRLTKGYNTDDSIHNNSSKKFKNSVRERSE